MLTATEEIQEVLGRTSSLLSLRRQHRKRLVQQFFHCGVCIRCLGDAFYRAVA
jgi:hypothetical protein